MAAARLFYSTEFEDGSFEMVLSRLLAFFNKLNKFLPKMCALS